MSTDCRSPYLQDTLDNVRLKKVIGHLSKIIKRKIGVDNFDAIAYRGMSGAGIATTIGYLFDKPLIMVRKDVKSCHSSSLVEGAIFSKRIIIIDDCISTGNTLITTVDDIVKHRKRHLYEDSFEVVAILLYNDYGNYNVGLDETVELKNRFSRIMSRSYTDNAEHLSALETLKKVKFYNFRLELLSENPTRRYRTICGSDLVIDDLK